jgi:hypothetical protein
MFLTKQQYDEALAKNKYWQGRWEYLSKAVEILQTFNTTNILEIGCNGLQLCDHSDTMSNRPADNSTYTYDITQVPWPVNNNSYDVLIALQVWEHLQGCQSQAFSEARSVARNIVLSLPYMWNSPKDLTHHQIDLQQIISWTGIDRVPDYYVIGSNKYQRIICVWPERLLNI